MAKIKGVCKNIDDCSKAQGREVQEVEKALPFICEECEKPLVKTEGGSIGGNGGGPNKKVAAIVIGTLVLLGGGIAIYSLLDKDAPKAEDVIDKPQPIVVEKPSITLVEAISLNKDSLKLYIGDADTLHATLTPSVVDSYKLQWTSEDPAVATVEGGIVKAVTNGKTVITIKDLESGIVATSHILVAEKESEKDKSTGSIPRGTPSSGQFSYGRWSGGSKNGKPHGTQITFTFTSSHQIDSRDPKNRVASAGDYVIGEYDNGRLVQGRWYKKSGGFESVIIGK